MRAAMAGLVLVSAAGLEAQQGRKVEIEYRSGASEQKHEPGADLRYIVLDSLVEVRSGDLRVRAQRAVIEVDHDEWLAAERAISASASLPRRGAIAPLRQSTETLARVARRSGDLTAKLPPGRERIALVVRALWAEGDVVFEEKRIKHLRCKKLWMSFLSDRAVMDGVELRLPVGTRLSPGKAAFVLKSRRVVQQSDRLIARDARVSTCDAGDSHYEIFSQRFTLVQRNEVYEFVGEGNELRLEGLPSVALPDYRFYSDQENWLPIKSVAMGRSEERGIFGLVEFGGRWNDLGQSLVDLLSSMEVRFRGEWRLKTGYYEKRGFPFQGRLDYGIGDFFEGRTDAFYLNDSGFDRRSVRNELDGAPITERKRRWFRSRNRLKLGEHTRVDAEAFLAGDSAAYAEFQAGDLKSDELPETSLHLRHAVDNLRLAALARVNAVDFVYDETARLTDRFASERPVARADLFSQPLGEIADAWPIVLDAGLSLGQLRNQYDDRSALRASESAFRADLELELGAPIVFGGFALRPYVATRQTSYDETIAGGSEHRSALEVGIEVGTRFVRAFDYENEVLDIRGLRHEIRPDLRLTHRFQVDEDPSTLYQFDEVDRVRELSALDLGLLNRVTTRRKDARGETVAQDVLWFDLTQRLYLDADRDNAGDDLGLFAWEIVFRPGPGWFPLPNTRLLFEGERDWNRNEFRTRNVGIAAGPSGGPTFAAEWRSGADGDGTGSLYATAFVMRRWTLVSGLIWDFDRDELNSTSITLVRNDHDWLWVFGFSRSELTDDVSFVFRFIPTLGGLIQLPQQRYVAGDPAFGILRAVKGF